MLPILNIRYLTGKGVCIWGARTNAGDSSEWKYVNVRGLFIFIEQSILKSSDWIVFEPNTPKLWGTIIRNITVFLTGLWREGALFGSSAEEAFFIKVDVENNPPIERRKGNLVIEIGVAPVFPAEFVIIKIGQKVLPA
jgi:phage tail sheath protein FI